LRRSGRRARAVLDREVVAAVSGRGPFCRLLRGLRRRRLAPSLGRILRTPWCRVSRETVRATDRRQRDDREERSTESRHRAIMADPKSEDSVSP
jgi:hypothetical protein